MGTGPDARARRVHRTACYTAAPPCQTRGGGEISLAFSFVLWSLVSGEYDVLVDEVDFSCTLGMW